MTWINIKDQKPGIEPVLVYMPYVDYCFEILTYGKDGWDEEVTHWMEIPKVSEEE